MKNIVKILGILILISYKMVMAGNAVQEENKQQVGIASYYSSKHDNRKTASGDRFQSGSLTAAHRTFRFGTLIKVTNLKNNKSVLVTVNDRGPQSKNRVLDLSLEAAKEIDMVRTGTAKVKIEVIEIAEK
jgi:rare lipoprotein A